MGHTFGPRPLEDKPMTLLESVPDGEDDRTMTQISVTVGILHHSFQIKQCPSPVSIYTRVPRKVPNKPKPKLVNDSALTNPSNSEETLFTKSPLRCLPVNLHANT